MSNSSPERLPPIPEGQWTAAQRAVAAELIAGPRGGLRGPFQALLRSPELMQRVQQLGEYLRYRSIVPHKLRELGILAAARHWSQSYEWHTHVGIARKAGVPETLIDAIVQGQEPVGASAEEATVLAFCRSLHRRHHVEEPLYQRAQALLGEDGVVELCALCGYYALLAMVLNVAQTALPAGASVPFAPPD